MATKNQARRFKMKAMYLSTSGSTANRDTECNDLQYNDYAWHVSNAHLALNWIKLRSDAIL